MNPIVPLLFLVAVSAEPEYVSHGTPSKSFNNEHQKHGHNDDLDHQAILGLIDI